MIPDTSILLDLGKMINNEIASDLLVHTSDGMVYAHKCILLSQAPTFSSLIQNTNTNMSIIRLTGSFEGILRILIFIYTGMVTSTDEEELLKDILNANFFELWEMVSQCECMLGVTSKNAFRVLKFALDNRLVRLKHVALSCLAKKTGSCFHHEGSIVKCINTLNESHPGIGSELFELIKYNQGLAIIPRDRLDAADGLIKKARVNRKAQLDKVSMDMLKGLPLRGYAVLGTSILMSQILINSFPPGPWIFAMNIAFSVSFIVVIFTVGL